MHKSPHLTVQLLVFIVILSACGPQTPKVPVLAENPAIQKQWDHLYIKYGEESILIQKDSSFMRGKLYFEKSSDSLYDLRVPISSQQKDSLFDLFSAVIHTPPTALNIVSCYAGKNLELAIDRFNSPSTSCKYISIEDWEHFSTVTNRIYQLTFNAFKQQQPPILYE